jgi:amino acid permease
MAKEKEEGSKDRKKALKEKEKVKKEQEARLKKRLKAERKRLDKIVSFPFRSLFIVGAVSGILYLLYNYFAEANTFLTSLFKGFILFVIIYFGIGIILLIWFFVLAKIRQKEAEERKKLEEELSRERERLALEGKLERDLLLKQAQEKREEELRKLREQIGSETNISTNSE